jgi:hypothetical protein
MLEVNFTFTCQFLKTEGSRGCLRVTLERQSKLHALRNLSVSVVTPERNATR